MSKNIVVCSDGTGNSGGKRRGTNVWRIFNAVDRNREDCKQITYYDDGVGTHNIRLLRLLGGAVGWGLSRNIREAYEFLCLNYEKGDRIFLFGFSRGAFTVRSLAGMICLCGLLARDVVEAPRRKRERDVKRILHAYRSTKPIPSCASTEAIRKALDIYGMPLRPVKIHFVGVWDTVDAVGVPFGELKKRVNLVWQKLFKRRCWFFKDDKPHNDILHAYQALALDDERRTFRPLVWKAPNSESLYSACPLNSNEDNISCVTEDGTRSKTQTVKQVWFAGAHANVGGGYPKDSLSLVPLVWMMAKAKQCGLQFLERKWADYREDADSHGRMYDSRTGWGRFYRYARRNPYAHHPSPTVHKSVEERIARKTDYYAPKTLKPGKFQIESD